MQHELRPCATCGTPGVKELGTRSLCAPHLVAFYRKNITPETWLWSGGGIGLPVDGHDDLSPGWWRLECSSCAATWIGALFERCGWCERTLERMHAWQAGAVLTPPDVESDDRYYTDRMTGWAKRMSVAADAGLVTSSQAQAAWAREAGRVAA